MALADGSDVLGAITPEIAAAIGREAAPIRLPEGDACFGETHIEAARGKAIRDAGYADAAEMVADVAASFNRIDEGHSGRIFLVKANGRDRVVLLELRRGPGENEFSVVSAGLIRPGYLRNRRALWEAPIRSHRRRRRSPSARGPEWSAARPLCRLRQGAQTPREG